MPDGFEAVVDALARICRGEEVTFDSVKQLSWSASADTDKLLQKIYRELQMFASDYDIRMRDAEYDANWRAGLRRYISDLESRRDK